MYFKDEMGKIDPLVKLAAANKDMALNYHFTLSLLTQRA